MTLAAGSFRINDLIVRLGINAAGIAGIDDSMDRQQLKIYV